MTQDSAQRPIESSGDGMKRHVAKKTEQQGAALRFRQLAKCLMQSFASFSVDHLRQWGRAWRLGFVRHRIEQRVPQPRRPPASRRSVSDRQQKRAFRPLIPITKTCLPGVYKHVLKEVVGDVIPFYACIQKATDGPAVFYQPAGHAVVIRFMIVSIAFHAVLNTVGRGFIARIRLI